VYVSSTVTAALASAASTSPSSESVSKLGLTRSVIGAELDVVLRDVVVDVDELRGFPGDLETLGDDRRDDLSSVGDLARLEDGELARCAGKVRRILVREQRDHAGQGERRGGVDRAHRALRDRRLHECRVGDVLLRVLECVERRADDLVAAFDPVDGRADRAGRDAHAASSVNVRTSVLRASSIL
jgi:hypothetical protein